jgi:hypothetical protein
VLGPVRHADLLERRHDAFLAFRRLHAAVGERQLDVLVHVQIANQVEALKMNPISRLRTRARSGQRQVRTDLPFSDVLALGRRVEQAEDRQQRRLAAARRPGNRDVLAGLDVEVNPGEARASRLRR